MSDCQTLHNHALEHGAAGVIADQMLREHLTRCAACRRFLDDLSQLAAAVRSWPRIEAVGSDGARKAPPAHVAARRSARRARATWTRNGNMAAAVVLVVSATVLALQPALRQARTVAETAKPEQVPAQALPASPAREIAAGGNALAHPRTADLLAQLRASEPLLALLSVPSAPTAHEPLDAGVPPAGAGRTGDRPQAAAGARHSMPADEAPATTASRTDGAMAPDADIAHPARRRRDEAKAAGEPGRTPAGDVGLEASARANVGRLRDEEAAQAPPMQRPLAVARARAERFLAAQERVDGLVFQPPSGYWRNTYTPGDPAMRLLRTRLAVWQRVGALGDARLAEAIRANRQPLDAPAGAALGLYLQADKAAVSGIARVRLQVGLQGALRAGARPAMNLSVLLDLGGTAAPTAQQTRALVTALLAARQPGDRFSLAVAGPDGGLLIEAGDFRHGPLQVTLARLFGGAPPATAHAHTLPEALRVAARAARVGDDPGAAFGTSLVLLVSAGISDAQLPALRRIAHENALAGIALSVIDTGGGVLGAGSAALERLVAAGQGHRHTMARADEAARIVDAQLHAAGRAVARAARLRIRLAPGVRLIDVLGSEPLAAAQAARVREAEQNIDQRVARNLGIRADRGRDEDGIQIVIPSFYAGDSHVILFDLLIDGPGAVADVTLRYKDLLHLKNGVARAQLRLPSGDRSPGPLQRNVLKNRVAHELAWTARDASRLLETGDVGRAVDALQSMHDLLIGLQALVGGWFSDPELLADARVLAGYVSQLQANLHPLHRRYLVESLRYIAFRKLTETEEDPQT